MPGLGMMEHGQSSNIITNVKQLSIRGSVVIII